MVALMMLIAAWGIEVLSPAGDADVWLIGPILVLLFLGSPALTLLGAMFTAFALAGP